MSLPTEEPQEAEPAGASVGTRVAIGAAWMVGVRWGMRALGIVSTLVLARLLIPEDFGLVALATAYVAIVEGVSAMPMGQALIRYRDAGDAMYDTAWTLTVVRGLGIALVMVASAIPMAAFMNEPRLEIVIYVLALKPLIEGFENPRFIDFQKDLQFSRPAVMRISIRIVQVAVTIGAAVAFRSYWALVIGSLITPTLRVPMTYVLKPYRPGPTFSEFRKLFGFSGWLTGQAIVLTLNHQADKFIVGVLLDLKTLGIYHMGKELATLPTQEVTPPLTRALYPGLTMFADDLPKLRANALEATGIVAAIAVPIAVGFALVAEEFVTLALGEKWLPIVPILQIITPLFGIAQFTTMFDSVLMTRSKTHHLFYHACMKLVFRATTMILGAMYFGLMGLIYGWAATIVVMSFARLVFLSRGLDVSVVQPVAASWRSLMGAAVMATAVLAVGETMPALQDLPAAALAIVAKALVGATVYVVVHVALWLVAGRPAGIEARIVAHWPMIARFVTRSGQA